MSTMLSSQLPVVNRLLPAGTQRLAMSRRMLSSNQQPRFQIPAHVAVFSLLLVPVFGLFAYAERFGPDKEELEATLRERYGKPPTEDQIKQSKAMSEFFQKAIMNPNGPNSEVDQALNEVLRAGRGSTAQETTRRAFKNRPSAVTDSGTESKAAAAQSNLQSNSSSAPVAASVDAMKPKKKRKKNIAEATDRDESSKSKTPRAPLSETSKSVLLVTGVAALAAGVGYIAGGKRQ